MLSPVVSTGGGGGGSGKSLLQAPKIIVPASTMASEQVEYILNLFFIHFIFWGSTELN
jgi:hypothetical protein